MLVPLVYTLVMGFFKTDLFTGSISFAGISQFADVFQDTVFLLALKNTLVWTVGSVVFQFLIGFIIANILNASRIRGKNIIRIILMVPWVLPSVVSAMVWDWSYHPDYGILNEILKKNRPDIREPELDILCEDGTFIRDHCERLENGSFCDPHD